MKQFAMFALCLMLAAVSNAMTGPLKQGLVSSATAPNANRVWISPDFFIEKNHKSSSRFAFQNTALQDCRATLKAKMCIVDPQVDEKTPRVCLPGSDAYAPTFEALYDTMPPAFQRMFCSISVFYIETQLQSTAYAGSGEDENGKSTGPVIGIRKSLLDQHLTLAQWATWKEELSFGGQTGQNGAYDATPGLQTIKSATQEPVNDFLYLVIAHEFGHQFDFANAVNDYNCDQTTKVCMGKPGSWSSLSWAKMQEPTAVSDFLNRAGLCFYDCTKGALARNVIPQVYQDWLKSDFISLYSSTNPWDDFAESVAFYTIHQNLHTTYVIDDGQGHQYDVIGKVDSPQFANKYRYVRDFLNRTDIVYP